MGINLNYVKEYSYLAPSGCLCIYQVIAEDITCATTCSKWRLVIIEFSIQPNGKEYVQL